MKMFFLLLTAIILSTNLSFANPPDSCFWAPLLEPDGSSNNGTILGATFDDELRDNSNKTLQIDTCGLNPSFYIDSNGLHINNPILDIGSTQYFEKNKRYYSKSLWGLDFFSMPGIQIFDTLGKGLNTMEYFTVDDIDSSYKEIYDGFQKTRAKYGEIFIRLVPYRNMSIKKQIEEKNGSIYHNVIIETENIVNSVEFEEYLGNATQHPCTFATGFRYPNSIKETSNNETMIYPNPVADKLTLSQIPDGAVSYEIFDIFGERVSSTTSSLRDATPQEGNCEIDVSGLMPGVYFLKLNNQPPVKFIKL